MRKEIEATKTAFVPYKLCIETEEEHTRLRNVLYQARLSPNLVGKDTVDELAALVEGKSEVAWRLTD